jgi:hypothetical protein
VTVTVGVSEVSVPVTPVAVTVPTLRTEKVSRSWFSPVSRMPSLSPVPKESSTAGEPLAWKIERPTPSRTVTPLAIGSSQLLRRVAFVPPPVHDMKKRPYQSEVRLEHEAKPP